jgi:dihydroorotase
MKKRILILNASVVNEGRTFLADVLVKDGLIDRIGTGFSHLPADAVIDAAGKHLLPGVIDDQVHFREPGLTHKADLHTESRAAVAGGVTSFMEMPNTVPNTLTQDLLAEKYAIAARKSLANYSFFMGASNDNLSEILKTDPREVCGIKVFMGSSTGNMLVDQEQALRGIFRESPMLVATHCEDEATVRANAEKFRSQYGDDPPAWIHPLVRNEEACLKSSSFAVSLAKEYNTRLHILHISTADELKLFTNEIPLAQKRITAEVCVHHLWFSSDDYTRLGNRIKCNPAIKDKRHKQALLEALLDDRLDIIATDHAPHTREEKSHSYWQSHAGLPLVQHPLLLMLEFYHNGEISLEKVAEKMAHAPAVCFQLEKRGFLREGYYADLVLVDLNGSTPVTETNLQYKCGWSPLEGYAFRSAVTHTLVSGHLAYEAGVFDESRCGQRLLFSR